MSNPGEEKKGSGVEWVTCEKHIVKSFVPILLPRNVLDYPDEKGKMDQFWNETFVDLEIC